MNTSYGHLSYCTNIHSGESWKDHFAQLQQHIPAVKAALKVKEPFGIGLRVSNLASLELSKEENLSAFKAWLQQENAYVFTMNGFPFGGFHGTVVKDKVHEPDWRTPERVNYTIRLFRILAALLPEGTEGGISTSPLSYKPWSNKCSEAHVQMMEACTLNMLLVVEQLVKTHMSGGPFMHLDVEPEPDGVLENSKEYIDWYFQYLLPLGVPFLVDKLQLKEEQAVEAIKRHVQLCYDVCHFAISYEDPLRVFTRLSSYGLRTGKIQISAALQANMPSNPVAREEVLTAFSNFNEPTYLHQVIARKNDGYFIQYPDLPEALADGKNPAVEEWRAHFHVPVFVQDYGVLSSTQQEIVKVLQKQKNKPFTQHLEVETYTWDVLPPALRTDMSLGIARELKWVLQQFEI
ncbi:hypothetical protein LX64_00370 [Chitinophaga skermanii]|uniref:Xylose isomerase-like TIM barrel protein n=1 Tax=Chitinophaga skermanii TaxID=331697 RepID=A0A327R529_9BACT|nr:metabolite traffic protein EboE [Chitinophaga skermanii]RAJ10763.1 hypothetical protein LX64_00370 [Chitinophaga skermanii]